MRKSPEIGSGHHTTYFRELDGRMGRWWSTDPITFPHQSPYNTFDGNPIYYTDASGASVSYPEKEKEESYKANVSTEISSTSFARSYIDDWIQRHSDGKVVWDENVTKDGDVSEHGEYTYIGSRLNSKTATQGASASIWRWLLDRNKCGADVLDMQLYLTNNKFDTNDKINKHGVSNGKGDFFVDNTFNPRDFYSLVVSSFGLGIGYENYIFGIDSKVSEDLYNTTMTRQAINKWLDKGMADGNYGIARSPLSLNDVIAEWHTDPRKKGYLATITHTMGSANYNFSTLENGSVLITVTNSTSVGSATGGNAGGIGRGLFGLNGKYPRESSMPMPQPWTNVNQTIYIKKTASELKAHSIYPVDKNQKSRHKAWRYYRFSRPF